MHKDCIILCHDTDADGNLFCLKDVNEKKFIEYVTQYLCRYHICKIIFSISAQADVFKKYIMDNRDTFSFSFDFSEENEFNGSGTAVQNALQYSDTPDVLIVQGHTYFDVNLEDLMAWQQTKMGDVTMALSYQENISNSLVAHLNENNLVNQYDEVKTESKSGLIVAGTYCIFRPSFLNINFPQAFTFEQHYLQQHRAERDFIGMISEGYFLDISKNNAIEKASKDFPIIFSEENSKTISN